MTVSEDSLQKLIYQLSKTASTYILTISTAKTKILALKGKELISVKIVILALKGKELIGVKIVILALKGKELIRTKIVINNSIIE
jgi:hypothetical protein